MKTINSFSALLLFLCAATIASCSKDDGTPVSNLPIYNAAFTVDIDGEPYTAAQLAAVQLNGTLTITGGRGTNGEAVSITLPNTTPGTYTNAIMAYNPGIIGADYVNAGMNGSVTITSMEGGKVSGSFSFTGYWEGAEPIVFTNGAFHNIPVTQGNPVPVADGTVTAVVNGEVLSFINSFYVQADQNYIITGQSAGNNRILQISVPVNIGEGTYTIGGEADIIYATISGGAGSTVTSLTGTLVISSNSDGVLVGTFSFTGTDAEGNPVEVTTGEFVVEMQG